MKTIGVIIPNYNSGIYIKRCLDSLLEQEYRVNEIIVVDDCSTDESTKIVKEYTKNIIILFFLKMKKIWEYHIQEIEE